MDTLTEGLARSSCVKSTEGKRQCGGPIRKRSQLGWRNTASASFGPTDSSGNALVSTIYLEGGGDSAQLKIRCREGFRKLLAKCGFDGRMPKLVACGGRGAAFDHFLTAHGARIAGEYIALLIDSEDPMTDIEAAWDAPESSRRPGEADWSK